MVNNISICPEIISIGVRNEKDKNTILSVISEGIEIIIDSKMIIKPWKDNEYVPSPVVPYLTNMFGDNWKDLTS